MLVGVAPFWSKYKNPLAAMYHVVSSDSLPELPVHLSKDAEDFLVSCFERDPTSRPSVSKLMKHPFLQRDTAQGNNNDDERHVVSLVRYYV